MITLVVIVLFACLDIKYSLLYYADFHVAEY